MRILITGAGGQLGRELRRAAWDPGTEVAARASSQLDITDRAAVLAEIEEIGPDVVVNAAAYTAVDRAEDDEARAAEVNGTAVGHLADGADRAGALLIHLSTDYVFDGTKDGWYFEGDPTGPVSAYGRSKLVGERAAAKAERSVTLRTAWVYGALGSNFVATVLRLAAERDELRIVADQIGCPTATTDLAAAIVALTRWTEGGARPTPRHLYHVASPEPATWFELAVATLAASGTGFGGDCHPITTSGHPTRARRPANSRLASGRIGRELGIELPPWRHSLPAVVVELEKAAEPEKTDP